MKRIAALIATASVAGVLVSSAASKAAEIVDGTCLYSEKDAPKDAPRFADYPVVPEQIAHPAKPRLDSPYARLFRSAIRKGAADGPAFAGHYAVASWGCGGSCYAWALIDSRSGRVLAFPEVRTVVTLHVNFNDMDDTGYRLNSRLMIIEGAPDEDDKREGVAYYLLDGERLKLIRFYSAATLCTHAKVRP